MPVPIFVVDAFTDLPYRGNPAGVCLLDGPAAPSWMQSVAAEMRHSETAFLYRSGPGYALRWFTPTGEVDLCGHATLAAAHILFERGFLAPEEGARFATKSGELRVNRAGTGLRLDFPKDPARKARAPAALTASIPGPFEFVGRGKFDYLVVIASAKRLRSLEPDLESLAKLEVRGVIVTSPSDRKEYQFLCRFFAPRLGIPEDPATGSVQCTLGPYWASRLGREEVVGLQVSARGGVFRVRPDGDRVGITGDAITVLSGTIESPTA